MTPPLRSKPITTKSCLIRVYVLFPPGTPAGLLLAAVLLAAPVTGCSTSLDRPRPTLVGGAQTVVGADPSETPYHGWDAVDTAVAAGAIEHLVVATPIESIGVRFRTYTLLGPRDQPGELVCERTDTGVSLRIRIGRFGEPELETKVLGAVQRALRADAID